MQKAPTIGPQRSAVTPSSLQRSVGNAALVGALRSNSTALDRQPKGRPLPAPTVPMYQYVDEAGTTRLVSMEEAAKLQAAAKRRLRSAIERVRGLADVYRQTHKEHLDMGHAESFGDLWDKPSRIWGVAATMRAGVIPPYIGMWGHTTSLANRADEAVTSGDLALAARLLTRANESLASSEQEWNAYIEVTIGGAEKLVGELKVVRDTSFAIAIGAGAIVAAPIVAGGVATGGILGTGATALGTGAVTTLGGAALRGAADIAGQASAYGRVDLKATGQHVREHLKEDLVTGLSAGLAPGAGQAAGLTKQGLTLGNTMARTAAVQSGVTAASGTAGTVVDTTLALAEGASWEKARDEHLLPGLKETGISTVAAGLTAPAGTLGQNLAQKGRPLLGTALERGGEALIAGGSTLAMGGTWQDAAKNAVKTTVTSSLMAKGQQGSDSAKARSSSSGRPDNTPAGPASKPAQGPKQTPAADAAPGTVGPTAPHPLEGTAATPKPAVPGVSAEGPPGTDIPAPQAAAQTRDTADQSAVGAPPGVKPTAPTSKLPVSETFMAAARRQQNIDALADVPALQGAVSAGTKTPLGNLADVPPEVLRPAWAAYQDNAAARIAKGKQPHDFPTYLKKTQASRDQATFGEMTDAFGRAKTEIIVQPPGAVNERGIDSISYAPGPGGGRIKLLDNKAYAKNVGEVSALQENLPQNLADSTKLLRSSVKEPGAPPELAQVVLPRLEAAGKAVDAHVMAWTAKNPGKPLTDPKLQTELGKILGQHGIDRVVTTAGGKTGVGITSTLKGQGFAHE